LKPPAAKKGVIPAGIGRVDSLVISPDGRSFLVSAEGIGRQGRHPLFLCELASGNIRKSLSLPGDTPGPVAYSADGRSIAAGFGETSGRIHLLGLANEQPATMLTGFPGKATALAFSPDNTYLVSGMDDTSALVWKLPSRPVRPAVDLAPTALRALWADLAGDDAAKAHQAIWALVRSPEKTIPFFQAHLHPAIAPDRDIVAQLLRDLNSDRFAVRSKATQELERFGELIESALNEALAAKQPLESRQRIDRLLSRLKGPITMPAKLREIRAVETLEYISTPAARKLLENLARGTPQARVTQEAKESLSRIGR
jgi:hypothetical protein